MKIQTHRSHLFPLYIILNAAILIIVILWAVTLDSSPISTSPKDGISGLSRLGNWNPLPSLTSSRVRRKDCGPCSISPALCEEWGLGGLARAMSFMGSGESFKRFLVKAREGTGWTMSVIGGSVSEGRGLPLDGATHTKYTPRNLHRVIFDHLNELFPAENGSVERGSKKSDGKNGFVNGAVAGTGSEYFSMCSQLHVPDDADLVVTELAINDELELENISSFELLLRSVLELPQQPAVIDLQILALIFPTIVLGGDLHLGILQHYDIPTISLRNLILPEIMGNNTLLRKWFLRNSSDKPSNYGEVDLRHLSQLGHKLSGDLINTYIDMQVCELENWEASNGPATIDTFRPPRLSRTLISKPFDLWGKTPKLQRMCASSASKEHPLEIVSADGWAQGSRKGKNYVLSNVPGSTVSFKTRTTYGQVQVSALRSQTQGLGNAKCWVDNAKDKAKKMQGYWNSRYSVTRSFVIATGLKAGDHTVTCELLDETKDPGGGKEFRIAAVMSI